MMAEQFPDREVVVIVPASLQTNYKKELTKVGVKNVSRYQILSYEKFNRLSKKEINRQDIEDYENKEELQTLSTTKLRNMCKIYFSSRFCNNATKDRLVDTMNRLRSKIAELRSKKKINGLLTEKILIVDEAHRLRSYSGKIPRSILKEAQMAHKVILLTGTPIVNFPSDIAPLINIVKKENVLPRNKLLFDEQFMRQEIIKFKVPVKMLGVKVYETTKMKRIMDIKSPAKFSKMILGAVSFYQNTDTSDFPEVIRHYYPVTMSKEQEHLHSAIERDVLSLKDIRMLKGGYVDESQQSNFSQRLNAYLNKTRQVSNLVKGEIDKDKESVLYDLSTSPKLVMMLRAVLSLPRPALVYSHYLSSGLYPFAKMLEAYNIRYRIFSGEIKTSEKKQIIEDYNSGKFDVLLISSSGSEGLDLKRTRQIHIMEPHWNDSKIQQVIGRGIRYKSHEDLAPEKRNVEVFYWYSIFKDKDRLSADKYLIDISHQKKEIALKFYQIIQKSSIEVEDVDKELEEIIKRNLQKKSKTSKKSRKSKKGKKATTSKKDKTFKSIKIKKSKKGLFKFFGGSDENNEKIKKNRKPSNFRKVKDSLSILQVQMGLI